MFISRQQYDFLVLHRQNWMVAHWGEYRKIWCFGGVRVYAETHQLENLQYQLEG